MCTAVNACAALLMFDSVASVACVHVYIRCVCRVCRCEWDQAIESRSNRDSCDLAVGVMGMGEWGIPSLDQGTSHDPHFGTGPVKHCTLGRSVCTMTGVTAASVRAR
jgi:hypothetical protein